MNSIGQGKAEDRGGLGGGLGSGTAQEQEGLRVVRWRQHAYTPARQRAAASC